MSQFVSFWKKLFHRKRQDDELQKLINKFKLIIIEIHRGHILEKKFDLLIEYIHNYILPQIRRGVGDHAKISLAIGGYDDDPRPLNEIPEVIVWYKELYEKHPYVLYFLTPESIQIFFFVMLAGYRDILSAEATLLFQTFGQDDSHFAALLGDDRAHYQSILSAAKQRIDKAIIDVATGTASVLEKRK